MLFLGIYYGYKACNPTILNLSINTIEDKFGIVGLQSQIIYIRNLGKASGNEIVVRA